MRHIHIMCEYGEIIGYVEDNCFTLRRFNRNQIKYYDEVVNFKDSVAVEKEQSIKGHYGGDYNIMNNLVSYLNGKEQSVSTTTIEDSIYSHLCCYGAEKSRKEKIIVNIDNEYLKK